MISNLIGHKINGFEVMTSISSADHSTLILALSENETTHKYVVAMVYATVEMPTEWFSGHYFEAESNVWESAFRSALSDLFERARQAAIA